MPADEPPESPAAASRGSNRALGDALRRLPMFPLPGVVLFPHALLPLHIFEERYRKMARDLLASHRHLAVALLMSPEDAVTTAEDKPAVHPIMGVGEVVMAHELPDGRFNLVVRGRARVRLVEELISDEPYRLITARPLGDLKGPSHAELSDADQSLRALVGRLAESVPDGGELLRQVVAAQSTPHELVDVLAAALIADPGKRQRLLETRDVVRRIETVSSEIVAMTGKIVSSDKAN
jgi:uncharacterized protein